jgi:hypothetical protein
MTVIDWSRARCSAGCAGPTLPVITSANSSHLNMTCYQLSVTRPRGGGHGRFHGAAERAREVLDAQQAGDMYYFYVTGPPGHVAQDNWGLCSCDSGNA